MFIVFSFYLNGAYQWLLALVLIFSVGVIHGANDVQLIQKKTKSSAVHLGQIFSLYLGIVLLGVAVFYFFPSLGLSVFVGFSAFHFGEQHLEGQLPVELPFWQKLPLYSSYGTIVFGGLFYYQWTEVHQVIFLISQVFVSQSTMLVFLISGLVFFLFFGTYIPQIRQRLHIEFFLFGLFYVLFAKTNLILAFAVYFSIWHSWPSMQDQMAYLYQNQSNRLLKYLRSSFPYWAMSLIGLGGVYFYFDISPRHFLPLFFSFLAAITFPHTLVMGWLRLSEKKQASLKK